MKIVSASGKSATRSANTRGGSGHASLILFDSEVLGCDPSRPDNFYAGISILREGEFSTPRHRHNFDQYRYTIEGEADFGDGVLKEGMLGYFPEGGYYGPQSGINGTVVVVQFGSASGAGYIDRRVAKAAHLELKTHNTGYFEDGTYYRNPGVDGPASQDGNEVIFEHVMKRPMVYPDPQYISPILINTTAFPWQPVPGVEGLSERALGSFSSCRFSTSTYKLAPGAELRGRERGIYLVLSGSGTVEEQTYATWTALYLEDGEAGSFRAAEPTEILRLGLPALRLMSVAEDALVPAQV